MLLSPPWTLTVDTWLDYIWYDVPQRDIRSLHSHFRQLLLHLLKWQWQPELRRTSHSWYDTILEQRQQLAALLARRPSLRRRLPEAMAWAYPRAQQAAQRETGLPLSTFPVSCPWVVEQVLDETFWPEA
ncbi:MAG: DUF29 domain-containing protein [Candidatus Tectomicrobia bacterium]|uniref:DUF29 domain-containing protein n=1 Tax=Tectimicrobiota bacterium TaxID=2528274 RepID=A0A938B1H5_UNCTE|nr:DUF29 domain-containing protein [Candidatus Tectomicrobia bacterium]